MEHLSSILVLSIKDIINVNKILMPYDLDRKLKNLRNHASTMFLNANKGLCKRATFVLAISL